MQLDDKLCKLFYKQTGKVIDDIRDPYRNDYVKWLESKVNNGVLDDVNVSFLCDFVNQFVDMEIPEEAIKESLELLNKR